VTEFKPDQRVRVVATGLLAGQVGTLVGFRMYTPRDRAAWVRMDDPVPPLMLRRRRRGVAAGPNVVLLYPDQCEPEEGTADGR